MGNDDWIPGDEWASIVHYSPIVSVDLVVVCDEGVVLGRRTNEPAKGEWFVPGGTVKKNERLEDAVHRIANAELGIEVEIDERLGVYEHLYDTSDVDGVGSKHYVPIGYVVTPLSTEFSGDGQHDGFCTFSDLPTDLHPYVQSYLSDAGVLG